MNSSLCFYYTGIIIAKTLLFVYYNYYLYYYIIPSENIHYVELNLVQRWLCLKMARKIPNLHIQY